MYIFNVIVTFLLVIGGFSVADWLTPSSSSSSAAAYPVVMVTCLLPAFLFIKFQLPVSWRQFTLTTIGILILGLGLSLLDYYEIKFDRIWLLMLIPIFAFLCSKKKQTE